MNNEPENTKQSQALLDPFDSECSRVEPRDRSGSRVARFLLDFWPLFVVPLVLTALFVDLRLFTRPGVVLIALLANFVVSFAIGGSVIALYVFGVARLFKRIPSRSLRLAAHLTAIAGAIVFGAEIAMLLLRVIPLFDIINIPRHNIYKVSVIVVAVIWTIELIYERLKARARNVELREAKARRDVLKAQLETLQARTDPHFLFNSLNTVASLIDEDPEKAEQALEKLSDLFRYALEGSRRERVSLGEELTAVKGYLEVESLRLGSRFQFQLEIDPETERLPVPPLVLQPLVENAVLHGVSPRVEGGSVRVSSRRENGRLLLQVEDDGPGPGGSTHSGARTSLGDLRNRLELIYGSQAWLDAGRAVGGGYRVQVEIPLTTGSSESLDDGAREG